MKLPKVIIKQVSEKMAGMSFESKFIEDFVWHEHPVYIDREFKDAYISHLKDPSIKPETRFKSSSDMMLKLCGERNEMVSLLIMRGLNKCEESGEKFLEGQNVSSTEIPGALFDRLMQFLSLLATPSGATIVAILSATALVILDQASLAETLQILKSVLQ